METNGVILQYFEWYYPADGTLWNKLADEAEHLPALGITAVWVPSACKGAEGAKSRGYDIYDHYDLGEFNQKDTVRTKYGTKEQYLNMIKKLHENGIQVYADIVLNHLAGADENEKVWVKKMDPETNVDPISEPIQIEASTRFTYPGRGGKYSDFVWDYHCFSGVGYAADLQEKGVFKIQNEYDTKWEEVIGNDKANYDFLMLSDIEYRNPVVREEMKQWGKWYYETAGFDGVRLDALKHITPDFPPEWLDFMRENFKSDLFAVGEYWTDKKLDQLEKYIKATQGKIHMFDVPLHYNLSVASKCNQEYNLSTIFDNSLVSTQPSLAVTFVENHDTQPIQSLESGVEPWFKPLAYALILLRKEGYPCVFYADFYGTSYEDKGKDGKYHKIEMPKIKELPKLLVIRKHYAYGDQKDYFDNSNCIGWVREGNDEHPGCVVILSNGENSEKNMEVGKQHSGKHYVDFLQNVNEEVIIDENGTGTFPVNKKSVSVWVLKEN
ncbi:alpha-amylase [Emticicia sp. C21]|uniref:alpha-amylase n=1 Tax=Emticicia sp. C21 TaxID=2302915 RepID=UPI000E354424|nr:alpha-amylase [Emticicia sp. C21]RFS17889.1 alpha-amylase [Emticicia sp. C21]